MKKTHLKTKRFLTSIFLDFWLHFGSQIPKSNPQKSSFFANLGCTGALRAKKAPQDTPRGPKRGQKSAPRCPKTPQESQNESKRHPKTLTRPPQGPSQDLPKPGINANHHSYTKSVVCLAFCSGCLLPWSFPSFSFSFSFSFSS